MVTKFNRRRRMSIIKPKTTTEIEKLLSNEKGIELLDKYCSNIYDVINKYNTRLKARKVTEGESVDEALDKIVGYRGFLNPILEVVEAIKKNRAEAYYINLKEDAERDGNKFISAVAERESSHNVADLRVIRNKVRAYVDQCNVIIGILQSKLKYYSSGRPE